MKNRRLLIMGLMIPLVGMSNAAAGTPAPLTSTGDHVTVATPTGTAGWVSKSYVQAHPHFLQQLSARTPALKSVTPLVVVPASHSGCNRNVCIDVTGSGLNISKWTTTAFGGNYTCTKPVYERPIAPMTIYGPQICAGPGDGTFYDASVNPTGNYPDGSEVCNVWLKLVGQACATIHS